MRRRVLELLLWLPALFLVYVFVRQGLGKFDPHGGWARAFAVWHFPVWFRIAVGVAEIAGALLLLVPRTAFYGAALIAAIMIGAMLTHVYWHRPKAATNEIFPLALATIVMIGRRPRGG
jgi:putative oxidoreductase